MTVRDLKIAVSSFCYTDIGEKDIRFISYANLALRTVFNDISVIGEYKIASSEKPLIYLDKLIHKGGSTETLPLSGNSFSMILSGKGNVILTDSDGERHKFFDTEETAFCGFLSEKATLTLHGEEDFIIYSLSAYKNRFENDESKIPVLKTPINYSMRQLVGDFHSFFSLPTDENLSAITDITLLDDKIIMKAPHFHTVNVLYKRLPKKISCDFPDEKIDIPENCEELLTILCSYFMMLEDEKDRAEYFKELYQSILNTRKNDLYERSDVSYSDVNGWA